MNSIQNEVDNEKILGLDKQTAIIGGLVLAAIIIVVLFFAFKNR